MKTRTHIFSTVALLILATASGCDREAVAAFDTSNDRQFAVRSVACDEIVIPQGFALGWKRFNHRLSRWGMELDHEECAAKKLKITQVGGIFSTNPILSDYPWARFRYQRARSTDDILAARVSIRDVVTSDGVVKSTAEFDLEELGLAGFDRHVALIEGIRYDTSIRQGPNYPALYNPGRGYTTRAIGAMVEVYRDGDKAKVDYEIHFDTGPTPERIFMNRSLQYARIGADLDVIIIGLDGAPMERADIDYEMSHERALPFMDVVLPPADKKIATVMMNGDPKAPRGLYGLTKFHFELDFDDTCEDDDDCTLGSCGVRQKCVYGGKRLGEYIREISVSVDMAEYDAESGAAQFQVNGYTSNASSFVAYYPLRYTFQGGVAWIQGGDASSPKTLEREFETGATMFQLD